jgi:hypothetical protein
MKKLGHIPFLAITWWELWCRVYVQPLKLPILRVRVPPQELPIYLGSNIRLRRR